MPPTVDRRLDKQQRVTWRGYEPQPVFLHSQETTKSTNYTKEVDRKTFRVIRAFRGPRSEVDPNHWTKIGVVFANGLSRSVCRPKGPPRGTLGVAAVYATRQLTVLVLSSCSAGRASLTRTACRSKPLQACTPKRLPTWDGEVPCNAATATFAFKFALRATRFRAICSDLLIDSQPDPALAYQVVPKMGSTTLRNVKLASEIMLRDRTSSDYWSSTRSGRHFVVEREKQADVWYNSVVLELVDEVPMPAVSIRASLWSNLVAVAEKKRKKPEALAQQVLSDYVQQVADEELLSRSARAARRARFKTGETEEVVRRYRRRK